MLADYPLKDVRNFAAGGGHSLLWPEATTFLSHRGAYSRPEAATVACGRRPQGFMSQKSRLKSGHLVTLVLQDGLVQQFHHSYKKPFQENRHGKIKSWP